MPWRSPYRPVKFVVRSFAVWPIIGVWLFVSSVPFWVMNL